MARNFMCVIELMRLFCSWLTAMKYDLVCRCFRFSSLIHTHMHVILSGGMRQTLIAHSSVLLTRPLMFAKEKIVFTKMCYFHHTMMDEWINCSTTTRLLSICTLNVLRSVQFAMVHFVHCCEYNFWACCSSIKRHEEERLLNDHTKLYACCRMTPAT